MKTGDRVPADGVVCPNTCDNLQLNEADLTGESMPLEKTDGDDVYVHADTFVVSGMGTILIVAVGKDTLTGKIKEELMEKEEEETPLQIKLNIMAELIGYVGMSAAVLTLFAICVRKAAQGWEWEALLHGFIVAVTIVVVAVPEGLPLAVTIALAYSMNAMYDENIFVKVLSACETMGGATCICSDKTGTLTQGIMSVTGVHIGGKQHEDTTNSEQGCVPELPEGELKDLFAYGIAVNSDASVVQEAMDEEDLGRRKEGDASITKTKRIGNFTECALIMMLDGLAEKGGLLPKNKYLEIRKECEDSKLKVKTWPFDSAKKRMSILVKHNGTEKLFLKGAGEQVLALCDKWMDGESQVKPLDDATRADLTAYLDKKTKSGFRLLCMAYKDMGTGSGPHGADAPDDNLTLLGVVAILDPLREEVPLAVKKCQGAGVKVIMVTGDHKDTAQHIAEDCGIYRPSEEGVVMVAAEFRKLYDEAFLAQHGTRIQRYVRREEKTEGEELLSVLHPYLQDSGPSAGHPVHWREAIGPCCGKPPKHCQVGQKEKADEYVNFPPGFVRGKPQQLDMWSYGVQNHYDPEPWPEATQTEVEALRQKAVLAWLIQDPNTRAAAMGKVTEECKAAMGKYSHDDPSTHEINVALEKMGCFILPPADFRDAKVMGMSVKQREEIDGGPLAAKLWVVVDHVLYKHVNGERVRAGGLQVLARSLPDDKLKLVRRFMKCDEIVGVTGDGTNDAPALRNANVGLAMGSGTQVARDAAHITILDDNFASIVNAIKWGRNIFDNIRKFLQFQLTVNIVALFLTFVMACIVDGDISKQLPLNAVMLLWVNLIMDSMGALALATETPTDALLDRPPHGKERLLSVSMMKMNLFQAFFQLILLFLFASNAQFVKDLCAGTNMWGEEDCKVNTDDDHWESTVVTTCTIRQNTLVFNIFVFCQFWNEINCRRLKETTVFEGFFNSMMFTYVLIFTFILQFIMIEFGSSGVGTNGLTIAQWALSIGLGTLALPVGWLARQVDVSDLEAKYNFGRDVGDAELEEEDEEDHPQLVLTESSSLLQLPIQLPEEEEAAAAVASTDK